MKWIKGIWIPLLVILAVLVQGMGEVEITTEEGSLYGTLDRANGHPGECIVLIAGSGPTDRDCNSLVLSGRMDSFLQLSQALNEEGYSVFRYDKRTAGESRESFGKHAMVFDDFVQDAILVVETMREMGYEKIHLVGHSQGAMVAMRVAQATPVTSVVHLSGPSDPIDVAFLRQLESLPKELYEEATSTFEEIRLGEEIGAVSDDLQPFFTNETIPFLLNWMQYDPIREALAVEVPLLFIGGGEDTQVLAEDLDEFASLVDRAEVQLIPNMNHVLKRVESERENQQSYQDPSFVLDPDLVESIVSFLAHT